MMGPCSSVANTSPSVGAFEGAMVDASVSSSVVAFIGGSIAESVGDGVVDASVGTIFLLCWYYYYHFPYFG